MKSLKITFVFFLLFVFSANSQIFFSEYAEGSSYNKYLEIYNYSSETVDLTQYAFPSCSNGCNIDDEWDYMNYFPDGATVSPGSVYVIAHPNAINPDGDYYTEEIAVFSNHQFNYLSNGNDVFALVEISSGLILDIIGTAGPDPGTGWDVAGITNATKDHTLLRKSYVVTGNGGDWLNSAGSNADDSEWIVLDNETWDNLGFHDYDNNSSDVFGCMCDQALNYLSTATVDDGSCVVDGGCSDSGALNYAGDLCLSAEFINEDCQYETVYVSGCYWCDLAVNYFDFGYQITANNMTILLPAFDDLMIGDVIGVFYVNQDGFLGCGGAVDFQGEQVGIAAWGDDSTTSQMDGFQPGDSFLFLVLRNGIVYETETTLNQTGTFTNVYGDNNFGQVTSFSITGEFIEECMLPLGVSEECDEEIFQITDNKTNKEIIGAIDLFGRHSNSFKKFGFHIIKYNDGTIAKKIFLNH